MWSKEMKQKSDKMCIIGSDVVSLFPSLQNIETGRLARYAILESNVEFEHFNLQMDLRYIKIGGGDTLLQRAKLDRLAPKWLGDRFDLTTVGGAKSIDNTSWKASSREIYEFDKKRIVSAVLEILR